MTVSKKTQAPIDEEIFLLEEFAPFQMSVVANRVSQAISQVIDRKFKLHIPEWRMLSTLAKYAPCSAQLLVDKTAMEPARVSRAQLRLVDLGMIEVQQDPEDRRRVIISLTEKGRTTTREMIPEALETEDFLFSALTSEERAIFETSLAKLFARTVELEKRYKKG